MRLTMTASLPLRSHKKKVHDQNKYIKAWKSNSKMDQFVKFILFSLLLKIVKNKCNYLRIKMFILCFIYNGIIWKMVGELILHGQRQQKLTFRFGPTTKKVYICLCISVFVCVIAVLHTEQDKVANCFLSIFLSMAKAIGDYFEVN